MRHVPDYAPLVVRFAPRPAVPAFVPTASYAGVDVKKMPAGQARPLGVSKKEFAKKNSDPVQKVVDIGTRREVDLDQAMMPTPVANPAKEKMMTLTFKGLSKNQRNAFYTGAATPIRISLTAFPDKQAPETIEVGDGAFAPARQPKAKMTPEERKAANAAKPKLTLAEKVARREAQLAKDKAKLAAQQAQGEQM